MQIKNTVAYCVVAKY